MKPLETDDHGRPATVLVVFHNQFPGQRKSLFIFSIIYNSMSSAIAEHGIGKYAHLGCCDKAVIKPLSHITDNRHHSSLHGKMTSKVLDTLQVTLHSPENYFLPYQWCIENPFINGLRSVISGIFGQHENIKIMIIILLNAAVIALCVEQRGRDGATLYLTLARRTLLICYLTLQLPRSLLFSVFSRSLLE